MWYKYHISLFLMQKTYKLLHILIIICYFCTKLTDLVTFYS